MQIDAARRPFTISIHRALEICDYLRDLRQVITSHRANMSSKKAILAMLLIAAACGESIAQDARAPVSGQPPAASPDKLAAAVAELIADAIPREYERTKDWGRTTQITTGLRSSGNFFKFDIHRTKSTVKDGFWKHYRANLVEPEKNLVVRIDSLRSLEPGKIAFTLFTSAKLHGWARAKVYESGVHLISLEAEADAKVRLWLDCELALESAPASFLTGIAVRPHVCSARMKLDEFRLTRVSDVSGPVVREIGDGLRHLIEDELNGPKLADKLNRSIDKRRDKLVFTPQMLLGTAGSE